MNDGVRTHCSLCGKIITENFHSCKHDNQGSFHLRHRHLVKIPDGIIFAVEEQVYIIDGNDWIWVPSVGMGMEQV